MIEFYGDSFSADTHGWPSMLASKLSLDLINKSISGSSITETIKILKEKNSFGDVVCITVSSPDRLYHSEYFIQPGKQTNKLDLDLKKYIYRRNPKIIQNKELATAVKYYYTELENEVTRNITYECQFNWFLNLTNNHPNTKFVIIPCFELTSVVCKQYNAIITSPVLTEVLDSSKMTPNANHMDIKQNNKLSCQLYDLILDYDNNKSKYAHIDIE